MSLHILVSDVTKKNVLLWKFGYYNQDNNDVLTSGEQHKFRQEVDSFLFCNFFFSQLMEVMDPDSDADVSLTEWGHFFASKLLDAKLKQ